MRVPYVDLGAQWRDIRSEVLSKVDDVLESGSYLDHGIINQVEARLAEALGVKFCTTTNSGTDALLLVLYALGIGRGDEVITVPNSFIASVAAIEHVGATTRFVDVGEDHLMNVDMVEELITSKTRAVMAVHLEGKMCDMVRLQEICKRHNLIVIEDAAQAMGSRRDGFAPGSLSEAACFSLHPLKNLNACGDSGFVASNNPRLIERIASLKNHGQIERNLSGEFGFVSRMDSLQAAIVDHRLSSLETVIHTRKLNAEMYVNLLGNSSEVKLPVLHGNSKHTFHLFVVEIPNRNNIQDALAERGVETRVHYPRLISQQPAFVKRYGEQVSETPIALSQSSKILSLPIHQHLSEQQICYTSTELVRALGNS